MFVGGEGRGIVRKSNEWFAPFRIERPWSKPASMSTYSWHVREVGGAWKRRGG
jgi:hypothetical protein